MDNTSPYISQEQQEEFERFLMQRMNGAEETTFTKKLENNASLKKQFKQFKTLFKAIEEEALRRQMEKFHEGVEQKGMAKKSNFSKYRIAAGVAILISVGIWFFNRPSENERLFQEYFTPDPGLPTVMGSDNNFKFYEAMVDYKQGNYDVAIAKWQKLLEKKPENDTLNYFLGAAYLANKQHDKSIMFLKKVANSNNYFSNDAKKYLGLIFVKQNKIEQAKQLLGEESEILKSLQ